jgi:hypothetical protein
MRRGPTAIDQNLIGMTPALGMPNEQNKQRQKECTHG